MRLVPASARKLALGLAVALMLLGAGAAQAGATLKGFDSPSGNIGCVMEALGVRCDIAEHDWQSPPKPSNCELDYGGGVAVDKHGKAGFVCAGDTTLHSGPALPYGKSLRLGRFRCTSKPSEVRCVNTKNGHGFALSRQFARLF
jgi:hypothetical protein